MNDDHFHAWRAEEEAKRQAGADLLAYIRARAEAEEARTRHLLDLLTSGVELEHEDDDPDDLKEAA
jgi:hypothetical protein